MKNLEKIYHWETSDDIKTLWELLQEVIEKDDDKWYSIHEFLLESTEEDRKRIEEKLTDEDSKQFFDYMDWFTFVNKDEVYMACCEYYEKSMNRSICMWECWDMYEVAEYYMSERWLNFDDDEEEKDNLPF